MTVLSKRRRMNRSTVKSKIILSLASGRKTFYDFSKKENIAAPATIIKALKDLQAQSFIDRGVPETRGKQPYRLMYRGLLHVLSIREVYENIDKVAEEYSDILPFIFGKWELFKAAGFKELLVKRFQRYQETFERESRAYGKIREGIILPHSGLSSDDITLDLLCPWISLKLDLGELKEEMRLNGELDIMETLRNFVMEDKDLYEFVDVFLNERIQEYASAMFYIEDWRSNWWGLDKKV